jgi:hypothetical protein
MKVDKYAKDVFKKLDGFSSSDGGNGHHHNNGDNNNGIIIIKDDDYYYERGLEPPRFAYYRYKRAKKCDAWGNKTYEDIYETITQDELDYGLKRELAVPPEQRYQHEKQNWLFHHELSYYTRDIGYDKHGCTSICCIPECRFYPKFGKIEDEEVIREHRECEERYRKRNVIVSIDIEEADFNEFLEKYPFLK